jgi:hypothetical protein
MQHESGTGLHHEALNELALRLRAGLAALVDETEGELHREQPELIARVDPALLREGIAFTHERFIALLEGGEPDERGRHIQFGAAMAGSGVSVDGLLAGYRVGARVGWRHTARLVAELDVPSAAVLALATASMAYMDELAANSLEGFARGAAAVGGARARERQALLDALVAGREGGAVALASAARWSLPERLRVAVLLGAAGDRLDDRVLLLGHAYGTALAIAREDDEGARALLEAGVALAAGPAVPPEQAPLSLARARRVAALAIAGVLPVDRALIWEDHLADLMLHADAAAGEVLVSRRLEPLTGLPPAREHLLRETLAAWLEHPGRPREIARTLHLHHQTVRYRLARLRERFGDDLDDPGARFELALALRVADGMKQVE